MRKILSAVGALLLSAGVASAGSGDMVSIPAEDYKAILEQLQALQKRVDVLEGRSPSAKASSAAMPDKTERLAKDVDMIYDTLDEVETKTLKDKLNFGAEVRTRVDNFKVKDHVFLSSGSLVPQSESNDNSWSNRFRFNMDAEIAKNLFFTGRLTVYKNFADSDSNALLGDANRAHLTDDSTVKLDRAYIDWIPAGLPVPLAVTFGRHPSSEGPPFEFKENRVRQSTYPSLLFDGEADGIVVTAGLERYLGWKNSGLRFAYGKAYQDDDDISGYLDNPVGLDDTNVYAVFFETEIPGVDDSLLVLSVLRATDFTADLRPLGGTDSGNVGDMELYGIHAQASDIMDSGLDFFLSTGLNKSHPQGTVSYFGMPMGLLSDDGETSHSGWAVYTGLRYTVPYTPLKNPKIGFEYNHGSDYWFSFTQGSAELYNKLATRGDVYDVYYIQPFNDNLFMRVGYTYADYDYSLSGFHIGDFGDSDEDLRNAYMLLDCRF